MNSLVENIHFITQNHLRATNDIANWIICSLVGVNSLIFFYSLLHPTGNLIFENRELLKMIFIRSVVLITVL